MGTRIVKHTPDANYQYDWLMSLPCGLRPPGLKWEGNDTYSCEYVRSWHPDSIVDVQQAAMFTLWGAGGSLKTVTEAMRRNYLAYVADVAWRYRHLLVPFVVKNSILHDPLTFANQVHGDLTLHNVLVVPESTRHRLIFIDPGHSRGLPARELDEAKLLQTADGFCKIYAGVTCNKDRFPIRRVHLALSWTHYLRLLPHMQEQGRADCVDFALTRMKELEIETNDYRE